MELDNIEEQHFAHSKEQRTNLILAVGFMAVHTAAFPLMEIFSDAGGFDKVQHLLISVAFIIATYVLYQSFIRFAKFYKQQILATIFQIELWFSILYTAMRTMDNFTEMVNPLAWNIMNVLAFLLMIMLLIYILRMPSLGTGAAVQWLKYWVITTVLVALGYGFAYSGISFIEDSYQYVAYFPLLQLLMLVNHIVLMIWVFQIPTADQQD